MSIDTSTLMVGESLSSASTTINGYAAEITGELAKLANLLAPLEDYWTGVAQQKYEAYQAEWNTAAIALFGDQNSTGLLGEIAAMMGINYNNYSDGEVANVATWQADGFTG